MVRSKRPERQRVEYSPIRYPDGRSLSRPLDMPEEERSKVKWFLLAAGVIGIILIFFLVTRVVYGSDRNKASIEEVLETQTTLNLPVLPDMPFQPDDFIRENFANDGYTLLELDTDADGNPLSLDVMKLPEGMSELDAQVLYARGLDKIEPAKAVSILDGSWRLTVERDGENVNMKVRYADFTSESPEEAIVAAKEAQNLSKRKAKDSGVDASGNTYETGTFKLEGRTFQWKVSACKLSDVYKINDLPREAYYVGVHVFE